MGPIAAEVTQGGCAEDVIVGGDEAGDSVTCALSCLTR